MSAAFIKAASLGKTYTINTQSVEAIHDISFSVDKGEILTIMGPSGCGKTTLLNCLTGLDEPSSGEVWIDGKNIHTMPDNARSDYRARHMGFVFQYDNLLPVLTAEENVELPLVLTGVSLKDARQAAQEILARVGLEGRGHHKPAELSGGQRQRVAIARALVNKPLIIWADEPTGDLDDKTSVEIVELFLELNRTLQQTFIIVSHDPDLAARTQRIIRMKAGTIVEDTRNS
ncbi:MAG TPA: ABC transporter ATP-binding protein [bacterium]|nr:ABC transporter ATP-binding protein [bacterium]